jgi:hypothetical protein
MHIPHIHLKQTFRVIVFECLFFIVIFIFLSRQSNQPKNSYNHVTGKIDKIANNWGILLFPDTADTRYIKLENFPLPFVIDLDSTATNIYELRVGDTITVWFDKFDFNDNATINRHLEYIDKGKKQIYKAVDYGIVMAEFIVAIFFGIILLAGYLYKRGKIPF